MDYLFEGYPHVLESQQFSREFLDQLFNEAETIRAVPHQHTHRLADQLAIIAFGEVSTRTFTSFDIAARSLGATVTANQAMNVTSSVVKGEPFEDTVMTLASYRPDFLIMRWPVEGSLALAASLVGPDCAVINAGDGAGQHPTQALLDLYTIWRHFRSFDRPIVVGVVGDLLRGRTTHSLVYLMAKLFPQISFFFISPESAQMKPEIINYLDRHGRHYVQVTTPRLDQVAEAVDVLYMTRPQLNLEPEAAARERLKTEYERFVLTPEIVGTMKPKAIIMHPLPRNLEIPDGLYHDHRAVWFEQAANGRWVRMALMTLIAQHRAD